MESVFCLLRSLNEKGSNLVNVIDFGDEHSGDKGSNNGKVFEINVKPDSLHAKVRAENLEEVQRLMIFVIDNIATVR